MNARTRPARWAIAAAAAWMMIPTSSARAEPPAAASAPRLERYCTGMMVTGIIVTAATAPLLFGGLSLRLSGTARDCLGGCPLSGSQKVGVGLLIGSAATLAAGIPLIIIGRTRVPSNEPATWVVMGAGSATLHVSF